jgi:hypothetical protein
MRRVMSSSLASIWARTLPSGIRVTSGPGVCLHRRGTYVTPLLSRLLASDVDGACDLAFVTDASSDDRRNVDRHRRGEPTRPIA